MQRRCIGILTGGGDGPGLNAVIRSVVRAADKLGRKVIGFRDGFEGLLSPGDAVVLERRATAGIMSLGGTILGTSSRGHFISKTGRGEKATVRSEVIADAMRALESQRIEGLIVVDSDGSWTTAQPLFEAGLPIVGVPKTIDNDLEATAVTFGFDSAVACVVGLATTKELTQAALDSLSESATKEPSPSKGITTSAI